MAAPVIEFVAGWNVVQTLGEGAFGEVKLLINQDTGEAVAMKIVDLNKHPDAVEAVRKEVCLHKILKHQNIIKFFGSRKEDQMQYMFLEYAVGGELFDRIEPDIGMPPDQAQKYFRDLINGVERELDRKCGTKPYMAPEVLLRPYNAEPADIWSCGVNYPGMSPPFHVPSSCHGKIKTVLNTVPRYRANIAAIKSHSWLVKDFQKCGISAPQAASDRKSTPKNKRICSVLDSSSPELTSVDDVSTRFTCSQPDPHTTFGNQSFESSVPKVVPPSMSFSQPANPDHLFLSTQLSQGTQTCHGSQTPLQKLVRRMTRVLVITSLEDTLKHLEALFMKMNYSYKSHSTNVLTVTTVDRRGAQLVLKANILDMGSHILVDFRLSKGCGLDFKRQFLKIKDGLSHILVKGPVTWSMALATNTLPA
ncbi:Serine/threonine-protein kinase grp [Armadillidium nasatum]|uniref:non-specific serine/threonine protein kinase n=1 Tax=Armadillidium nasatum TaxID=96803 RepID=A0A5N5SYL7_9CRUS|nr:Serine/threonine-protein kinase grp [Armadillidium nasatum]